MIQKAYSLNNLITKEKSKSEKNKPAPSYPNIYKNIHLSENLIDRNQELKNQEMSLETIDKMLELEKQTNKVDTWNKLNKRDKITKLTDFAEKYAKENELVEEEAKKVKDFLLECLEKNRLQKAKEIIYDKESMVITSIPALHYNHNTKNYTLKIVDNKRVSTLKSLTPKRG